MERNVGINPKSRGLSISCDSVVDTFLLFSAFHALDIYTRAYIGKTYSFHDIIIKVEGVLLYHLFFFLFCYLFFLVFFFF